MENIKQKLRRSVLYLLGFSAFPMLTSCYGMPQDYPYPDEDPKIEGNVLTDDQKPIRGILISTTKDYGASSRVYSNPEGGYTIYEESNTRKVVFSDIDGDANGGDFEQQSKTIEEVKANSKVIMKLKKAVPNE